MNNWLSRLSAWLDTLRIHNTIRDVSWIVPGVQTVHILCIGLVFSASLVLTLRAFGVSGVDWSPARWGARLNRWTFSALLVLLLTGAVMITGEPERSLLSPIFQIKMVLVIAAALLSGLLASRLKHLHGDGAVGLGERSLAAVIVLLWVGTISAGRWIAYYAA